MSFRPVRWSFFGKIFPDVPVVHLTVPLHEAQVSLGFNFALEGHAHQSKVMASVFQKSPVDVFALRNAVTSSMQLHADLLGFQMGTGLEVYFDAAQSDDGGWQFFEGYIPAIRRDGQFEFSVQLLNAVGSDPACHFALADFRHAIRTPLQTGFFCYRSMESAMQSFKTEGDKDSDGWAKLRSSLNVQRVAIDRVKKHADWARHGTGGQMTDDDRVSVLKATRSIVDRYLTFVVGGRAALDRASYPEIN